MSDVVKWGLLVAGALIVIALIIALPIFEFINVSELETAITNVVEVAGDSFQGVRGILNNFLLPFGRTVLTGVIVYLFTKPFITFAIKIVIWIYHFIFK